jgi:hypothetical protein
MALPLNTLSKQINTASIAYITSKNLKNDLREGCMPGIDR